MSLDLLRVALPEPPVCAVCSAASPRVRVRLPGASPFAAVQISSTKGKKAESLPVARFDDEPANRLGQAFGQKTRGGLRPASGEFHAVPGDEGRADEDESGSAESPRSRKTRPTGSEDHRFEQRSLGFGESMPRAPVRSSRSTFRAACVLREEHDRTSVPVAVVSAKRAALRAGSFPASRRRCTGRPPIATQEGPMIAERGRSPGSQPAARWPRAAWRPRESCGDSRPPREGPRHGNVLVCSPSGASEERRRKEPRQSGDQPITGGVASPRLTKLRHPVRFIEGRDVAMDGLQRIRAGYHAWSPS